MFFYFLVGFGGVILWGYFIKQGHSKPKAFLLAFVVTVLALWGLGFILEALGV